MYERVRIIKWPLHHVVVCVRRLIEQDQSLHRPLWRFIDEIHLYFQGSSSEAPVFTYQQIFGSIVLTSSMFITSFRMIYSVHSIPHQIPYNIITLPF